MVGFFVLVFFSAQLWVNYEAYKGENSTFTIISLVLTYLTVAIGLVSAIINIGLMCAVDTNVDSQMGLSSEKRMAIRPLALIIQMLFSIRPLVMLGFSHAAFPTMLLLLKEPSKQ